LDLAPRSYRWLCRPLHPSRTLKPPSGPHWVHKVKHDGYRLIVRRDGDTVRLFTRRGYDWSGRYPAIARAAAKLRAMSFTIDDEAAVCGWGNDPTALRAALTVVEHPESFWVQDAGGQTVGWFYFRHQRMRLRWAWA
jgi:ATP dependent DNA ligase-like protein